MRDSVLQMIVDGLKKQVHVCVCVHCDIDYREGC